MSILETPMALCSCGGRFRFDAQYLMDARHFGVALHTPILWRCSLCGRSLTRAGRPSPDYGFAPEAPRPETDSCGEALLERLADEGPWPTRRQRCAPGLGARRKTRARAGGPEAIRLSPARSR